MGQNRGQNPFTHSPRMAQFLEFFHGPMEPRVGFELSLKIRLKENCGFRGLAINAIVPQTQAK